MATLKELNIRLASLHNTRKITQAMKMIATTKMNRSILRVRGSKHYQLNLNKVLKKVVQNNEIKHILLQSKNKIKNIKVLLISSDRGLCGAFNSTLYREFNQFMHKCNENDIGLKVDFCGLKGFNFYQKKIKKMGENITGVIKLPAYEDAVGIGKKQIKEIMLGEIDEFYLAYNYYESALIQKPIIKKIIPFNIKDEESTQVGITYLEPSRKELADDLIIKNLYFEIFYALLNSVAGENSARMRAMDSATKNCDDMVDLITLQRNRVRQASITNELIEIISGAESL